VFVVRIHNGLGNQLFQYAYARATALRNQTEFKMDISWFGNPSAIREYGLNKFRIQENIASREDIQSILGRNGGGRFRNLRVMLGRKCNYLNRGFVQEDISKFDSRLKAARDGAYIYGYFGSPKYFEDVWPQLQPELKLKKEINGINARMAAEMESTESVCVGFRRGDFVNDPLVGVCGLEYAYAGIEAICSRVSNVHLYIWSDDNKWARESLRLSQPHTFVTHNAPDFYEDLRLMTYCKHHVIPNSTFYWWAAWMRKREDGIVVAPKRWLNLAALKEARYRAFVREWCPRGTVDCSHVIPDTWIRVQN
jgi:hypothetical protein